jgi:hypothetical protein
LKVLPENILRCMSPKDRKAIGQKTASEALSAGEAKSERILQGQCVNLLRLHGIEVLWHRTDKRSAATVGWPDLTFCVQFKCDDDSEDYIGSYATCWEIKLPTGKLSEEQIKMRDLLVANGWRWRTITSVDQARLELKNMGVE